MKNAICKILISFFVITLVILYMGAIDSVKAEKLPGLVTIVSGKVGSGAYSHAVAYAEAIKKMTGMTVKVEPRGTDLEIYLPLKAGQAEFAVEATNHTYFAFMGKEEFNVATWGPQPIRVVWSESVCSPITLCVRADSGIMTGDDLKGKRVVRFPSNAGMNESVRAFLAFFNLSFNDVIPVDVGSYAANGNGLLDGTIDAVYINPVNPIGYQVAAAPHGVRWIEFPFENKEGWARLQKVAPWSSPWLQDSGGGITKERPVRVAGFPKQVSSYNSLPDHIAYAATKALAEGIDYYKGVDSELAATTVKGAIDLSLLPPFPYHPGSIKFFKERGLWTSDHEKWQQNVLKKEAENKASWKPQKK